MIVSSNSCNHRDLFMQTYAGRRFLQQAAVALPSAPPPHDSVPANPLSAGSSVVAPNSSPDAPPDVATSPFNVSSQFSPTMVIILVILLSAFFFMGFFAIYVRRCTSDETFAQRGNSRGGTARRQDGNSCPQPGLGVDASMVESFPTVSYAAAKRKGCNECVVCLQDFEREDELKQLPKCKHVFHPDCIGLWLASHTTCPLCRRSLVSSDRWSMSWRWGGSSRGGSSTRLCEGESSHVRVGTSPGIGSAGSGSLRGLGQVDGESTSGPIPGSPLLPGSAPACLVRSTSMEMVPGCVSCMGSERVLPRAVGMATTTATSRLASAVGAVARALPQRGRRRLGRSNSTGHSLRRDVMSRTAAAAAAAAMQAGSYMPTTSEAALHRSRSAGRSEDEEDGAEGVGAVAQEQSAVSCGGGCSPALSGDRP